nr:hypothetical protein [Clostridium botulinum]
MRILAWIGFILSILNILASIANTVKGKTTASRIAGLIGTMLYMPPTYFFYMYLF